MQVVDAACFFTTPQPGNVWYMAGNFALCRFFSGAVALREYPGGLSFYHHNSLITAPQNQGEAGGQVL